MKRPLPTSIPSIIPAAVLAEAKKKKLVYVGTGDGVTDMFKPSIEGYYWEEGDSSLRGPKEIIGHFKTFHFFLPRKTAAKFFDLLKAPATKFVLPLEGGEPTSFWDNAYLKLVGDKGFQVYFDGKESPYDASRIKREVSSGMWAYVTEAEALSYVRKSSAPKKKTPLDLLTEENTLLKARVSKLEAAIRDAAKAL